MLYDEEWADAEFVAEEAVAYGEDRRANDLDGRELCRYNLTP